MAYKDIILDDSVLDIDSWLPQEALDEIVEAIKKLSETQSTGLFDKNGNEIFEDDIVKTTRFFGRADESGGFYEYEKELIGIVKQLEGTWVIDTEKGAVYLWSDIDENEVLGNIWENPGLLEEVKGD